MSELTRQQLSPEDKEFIKAFQDGMKKSAAFRESYPEHMNVRAYHASKPGTPERQRAAELLADAAKNKLNTKYIRAALATYKEKMEQFSRLSLETATDLVVSARSEKVRADLAIEGIRHQVGTPVQKVAVQEQRTVYLTFGKPPLESPAERHIVEAERVEPDAPDESDDT